RLAQSGPGETTDAARQALLQRHEKQLMHRRPAGPGAELFARANSTEHRVLFLDDTVPLRQLGSGFVRSNDLIRVMASLRYQVTVYPIKPSPLSVAAIFADMPDTVEVMYDRALDALPDFLAARSGYYDTIWIARTHNLDRVRPMLERFIGEG